MFKKVEGLSAGVTFGLLHGIDPVVVEGPNSLTRGIPSSLSRRLSGITLDAGPVLKNQGRRLAIRSA